MIDNNDAAKATTELDEAELEQVAGGYDSSTEPPDVGVVLPSKRKMRRDVFPTSE